MTVTVFALTIPGPPQGQGRARFNSKTGHAYTPGKTRTYAQLVQGEWIAAGRPTLPKGPYRLIVNVDYARPTSHKLRDGSLNAAGKRQRYPGKPDLDNVIKGLLDALCAVGAIPDDRHLVDLRAFKFWSEEPGVAIEVFSLAEVVA